MYYFVLKLTKLPEIQDTIKLGLMNNFLLLTQVAK